MLSIEVEKRMLQTKVREQSALYFLKRCGLFFDQDIKVTDNYDLDLIRYDKDGSSTYIGDLKLGGTFFYDKNQEELQNQQNFYLLSHSQFIRYRNEHEESGKDFQLYLFHLFEGDNLRLCNDRFNNFTCNKNKELELKEEISVLIISIKTLIKFFDKKIWKIVTLKPGLKEKYQKPSADGKIIKIDRRDVGLYIDLTRQWKLLSEHQRQTLRPLGRKMDN